ncbi:MAG: diadenylate cyclase [Nonlabens sp.]
MELPSLRILDLVDILLFAILIYYVYRLVRGSAAINIFLGIVIIYIIYEITLFLEMQLLSKVLGAFTGAGVFALIVVFQQEIRRFLLMLGSTSFASRKKLLKHLKIFNDKSDTDDRAINAVMAACKSMSISKTGALIVLKRESAVDFIKNTGDRMDILVNTPIIESIFFKNNPLHDGAMIIEGNKITATRAILPVSDNSNIPGKYGLRHRAAIGLTERSNAIAIIVSEETGGLSLAYESKLESFTDIEQMSNLIKGLLN